MAGPSEYVLVDACIARSVGAEAVPITRKAREVVDTLKEGSIGVCLTPLLRAEWEKHASRHMRTWLVQMTSRGRVRLEKDRKVSDFRKAVNGTFASGEEDEKKKREILKDAHLTECAILTKRAVLSNDDAQRQLLQELSTFYQRVGLVQWINPTSLHESCLNWIQNGCLDPSLGRIA